MKLLGRNKVVVWGYPLYKHTSSFVEYGYYRAFKSLGYDTIFTNGDIIDIKNAIIYTEQFADVDVPLDKSNFYILHNSDTKKYDEAGVDYMMLQVWTKDCVGYEKINPYTYVGKDVIFQPWATDLLPDEISITDIVKPDTDYFYWVGTYGDFITETGNGIYVSSFSKGIEKYGIKFIHIDPWAHPVTFEKNRELIRDSYVAPSIVCTIQKENGYLPCRIFKNISYGHFGATNSWSIRDLFDYHGAGVIYNSNEEALADDCVAFRDNPHYNDIVKGQISVVKNYHTYVNRVKELVKFIEQR